MSYLINNITVLINIIKIYSLYILILFSFLILNGCLEAIPTNPIGGGNGTAPTVTITSPLNGDTLSIGTNTIQYTVSQTSISKVELFINDNLVNTFFTGSSGSLPTVNWITDSLSSGYRFNIYLKVYNNSNQTGTSSIVSNVLLTSDLFPRVPPHAPFNLKITKISFNSVNLAWNDTSRLKNGVELWRKITAGGIYEKIKELPANSFNTNDEGLNPITTYFYKVRSYNNFGFSPFSAEVSSVGQGGGGTVIPPTNLTSEVLGTRKIKLTWQDNSNNENYFRIDRRISWSFLFEQVGIVIRDVTSFVDSTNSLNPNTEYVYRVMAISDNDSAWSTELSVRTHPYEIFAPTNLLLTNPNSKTVRVTWEDNSIYETITFIERRTGIFGTFEVIGAVGMSVTIYNDTTVEIGKTYHYRVRSSDNIIYSEYSNEGFITTQLIPVFAPTNLQAVFAFGLYVRLTWQDNSNNEIYFIIERRNLTAGSPWTAIGSVQTNVTFYDDFLTLSGNTYAYRVRAYDGAIYSNYSNEIILERP